MSEQEIEVISSEAENKVRYSQMTEDQATEQFEKRRQMLMSGLQKQHQLITKKGQQDKPPRHSSAKNLKPHTPQTPPAQQTLSQAEFVVYKTKDKNIEQSLRKILTKQQQSAYSSAQHVKQPRSQGDFSQKVNSNQQVPLDNSYREDRIKAPKPVLYSGLNDQNNSIQKISNIKKATNYGKYDSQESEINDQQEAFDIQEISPTPRPYPEPSPMRLVKYDAHPVGLKAKQNILGEIGSIDLEIKRMMREEESTPKALLSTFTAFSQTTKLFPNKVSGPYYDIRKKPNIDNTATSFMKESRADSSKMTSQRPSNQDIYGQLTYAQKASNRKSNNDATKLQIEQKNAYSLQGKQQIDASVEKMQSKESLNNIKPLNITIQFQQSIDNSHNLFSPTVQINKQHSSFSKQRSPARQQNGERLIVTDRKRTSDHSPKQNRSQKKENITKQTAATLAMQLLQNSSLKSLSPFQDKIKNSAKKTILKTPTPQPRISEGTSFYQNEGNLADYDRQTKLSLNTNSTKSQITIKKAIQKNQMSFQEIKQKGVEAQIDEAVKLYNNLKQLINCKSGGIKPQTTTNYRKLTTLDYFENSSKAIKQKENDLKQDKIYLANDLNLRTKNTFFQNFYDFQRLNKDSKEEGMIKKFEDKQKNLFDQVRGIQDQLQLT